MPEPVLCNKRSHSKWEARELQLESSPCSPQLFHMLEFVWDWGSTHSNEETAQPKINKYIKLKKGKKDYPSQYREHGFDPWSGKIPHAAKQVSLRSKSAWEPQTSGLEPGLCNKRNHCNEKRSLCLPQLEKSQRIATKTQRSQKKKPASSMKSPWLLRQIWVW